MWSDQRRISVNICCLIRHSQLL